MKTNYIFLAGQTAFNLKAYSDSIKFFSRAYKNSESDTEKKLSGMYIIWLIIIINLGMFHFIYFS